MSAKLFPALALLLAACTATPPTSSAERALSPDPRAEGKRLAAACEGRDGWSDPAPPARIFGATYYVGTCGIAVLLIASPEGHVLIDGATEAAVPSILNNIRALGMDPRDVKIIVGSHEHVDHMGGLAALKVATGARLLLSAPAARVMARGSMDSDDPQHGIPDMDMTPVAADATLKNGEVVRVGPIALTAHFTPGHTSGGTSWSWQSCEGPNCATLAYVDSLTAVSRDDYRFVDHPDRIAPFRSTLATVRALPCDILVTPHPGVSDLFPRLAGSAPLVDRDACRHLAHAMAARLDARLAKERAAAP